MLLARRGWPEETWFTFSLSAVGAAESGADGVFCACTETTGRVIGERRLRALGELAGLGSVTDAEAAAVAAVDVLARYRADVPAALLYLLDDQRRRARLVAAEGVVPGGPAGAGDGRTRRLLGGVLHGGGGDRAQHRRLRSGPRAARRAAPRRRPAASGAARRRAARRGAVRQAVVLPVRIGADRAAGVLVAGRQRLPAAGRRVPRVPRAGGHHVSTATRRGGRVRRAAAARRAPHRAGPHQDGVLRRDQRRVPHAADAGARPGRRAARRRRRPARRCARTWSWCTATRSACGGWSTGCWSCPGCTRGRSTRTSSRSTSPRSPPVWSGCSGRGRARRPVAGPRLPGPGRTRRRGPRDVGTGGSHAARPRPRRRLRRADHGHGSAGRTAPRCCASPRPARPGCSPRTAGSGWPWSPSWWGCWAAR